MDNKTEILKYEEIVDFIKYDVTALITIFGKPQQINTLQGIAKYEGHSDGWKCILYGGSTVPLSCVKPHLKPLSCLNEDEYWDVCDILNMHSAEHYLNALIKGEKYVLDVRKQNELAEFFNRRFIDWRYNLISRGLAIDIREYKPKQV